VCSGGTFLVTTEPAATTEFSPTVTPPTIIAPAAIHTFLSIAIGVPMVVVRRREGSNGWPEVMSSKFGSTSLPISSLNNARISSASSYVRRLSFAVIAIARLTLATIAAATQRR